MKGIAHFVTGIAIATCFPEVVQAAAHGSLLPLLGGIAAVVPDTLDFRLVQFLERYDVEIDPGPQPDAAAISQRLAEVMREAYHANAPRSVKLHTVRLGADRWQQYSVRFDTVEQEVAVRIGPVVDTGQNAVPTPAPAVSTPLPFPEDQWEGRAAVGLPMASPSPDETDIDIFSGPSFTFSRQGDALHIAFLDWHRRWSHSLTLAVALGLGAAGLAAATQGLIGGVSHLPHWVGVIVVLGVVGHILQDQLGHMGSNLLFPLTRARTPGLGLIHSADALPNFLTVWTALTLILFNLDRFSAEPRLQPWSFLGVAVVAPWMVFACLHTLRGWRQDPPQTSPQREALSEYEGDSFR